MSEAPTPIAHLELSIDLIGIAEQPSQAQRDASYSYGYLQALFDQQQVTLAQYREFGKAIKAALERRLAKLGGA